MKENYCPACNERFVVSEPEQGCPHCGAKLQHAPSQRNFDETQELAGPIQTQVEGAGGATPRELDHLVGKDLGVYRIESVLGRGGMGHVFVASHLQLGRRCALKILSPKTCARDFEYVERFQHEGRAAALLNHPNVTIIHAIGEDAGLHYLEMEMLTGGTLQQLVNRLGRVPPARAAELMIQACAGMSAAHEMAMIHRDLKPDNILLSDDQHPKIADFGLAKRVASDDGGTALAGTPNYMAPELFDGEPPSLASDVYALGATFFTLLSGHVPYAAESLPKLMELAKKAPVPDLEPYGIHSPVIEECLEQMLAKHPGDRCPTASEAVQLFANVMDQVRDLSEMTAQAFRGRPQIAVELATRDRQELVVGLPGGRKQRVVLEHWDGSGSNSGEHLLLIYSVCCNAEPDYYEKALRLNSQMSHGGVAIREMDGRSMFCVVDTYPWATVDAKEILLSTIEVAKHADAVEHELTGHDVH